MELRHIALRSLQRRKAKALLMMIGLTVAVVAFVLVLSLIFSMNKTMNDRLTRFGANLVVTPASPELSLTYGGLTVGTVGGGETKYLHESDLAALLSLPSRTKIVAAVPVLLQEVTVDRRPFLAMGTDLDAAIEVKPWWKIEGRAPSSSEEVLLGLNVRNALRTEPGRSLTLAGRSFTIAGVLWETGAEEDNLIIMERAALESLTGHVNDFNLLEITAANVQAVDELTSQIQEAIPDSTVSSVKKSIEFTNRANGSLAAFGLAITGLIVLISGLVVLITMLSAVKERQGEIGLLRAVGYKAKHIARLVLLETAILSLLASIAGVAAGIGGAAAAPLLGRGLTLDLSVSPLVALAGVALSFVVGLGAALYPAWRAMNLDPAAALRRV